MIPRLSKMLLSCFVQLRH